MRATILATVFAAAIGVAACSDDSTPVDPAVEAAAVGTYHLVTVNGTAIPFKYGQSDTSRFDIDSGTIILEANHNMSDETTTTERKLSTGAPIGEPGVQRYLGTWSIRGDSIRLSYPGLGIQMAGHSSTTLELKSGSITLTYSK